MADNGETNLAQATKAPHVAFVMREPDEQPRARPCLAVQLHLPLPVVILFRCRLPDLLAFEMVPSATEQRSRR